MSQEKSHRSWYKKKRYIIPLSVVGLFVAAGIASSPTPSTSVKSETQGLQQPSGQSNTVVLPEPIAPLQLEQKQAEQTSPPLAAPKTESKIVPAPTPAAPKPQPIEPPGSYINKEGNEVQSPTHYDSRPANASAQCRDGSYSFSQNRRGTCSHHGGVSVWY